MRIDHFEARGAELVDFDFAVKDKLLAGLVAAFHEAAVKKLAVEQAGRIFYEQVVDGIAGVLVGNSLAAHDHRANGVDAVGLDVVDVREMDAVFVAKGKVSEQVFQRENAALGEKFRALRADALDHAHFGGESKRHLLLYIIPTGNAPWRRRHLRRAAAYH